MAFVLNDRVKETSTTTGTGQFTLSGAITGFETFAAGIGNSNTTYYAIAHQTANEFEVGFGTLDGSSANIARTSIISSSNSDAAVNFSAGTKDVFCTLPSSKISLPSPKEYGSSSNPIIITTKVGTKTTAHPYSGQGSSSAYFLNGLEAPAIRLSGVDSSYKYYYRFDTSHSSNSGHPLRFYLEADKTTAYTTGVTTNGSGGSAGDYVQIAVDANTPNILFYQCSSHGYMGNHTVSIGNDFNGDVNLRDNLDLADSKKIKIGNSDDLQIYHDGSNSFIDNSSGAGALVLKPSGSTLITNSSGQNIISQQTDAAHLHYNGNTKLRTTNTGLVTSGVLSINDGAYTLPTSDGSANQILETDGSGAVTFVDKPTAGASAGFVIAMSVAL
mgnify:CR=1 FL=1